MTSRRQSGVSLIEALVALAVLAFGMLGLVGMQSSMRLHADVAKQQSEAVRIAQENIEDWRSYYQVTGTPSYTTSIVGVATPQPVNGYTTNTSYTWTAQVPTPATNPPMKTVVIDVAWTDRTGQAQNVRLSTKIVGIAPELAGSLGAPHTEQLVNPTGRNGAIPPGAMDQGDGTSRLLPPGSINVGWVFDNSTGVIVKVCNATFAAPSCSATNSLLLSGFVQFALTTIPPLGADSENPTSPALAVGVDVNQTAPTVGTIGCYVTPPTAYVAYYCAVPVTATAPAWSGQSVVTGLAAIASSAADPSATAFRVCRYTPQLASGNQAHPLNYTVVATGLTNQNFLVIQAGDGTNAFACPHDDVTTPAIDGETAPHQPP